MTVRTKHSTAVVNKSHTILDAAVAILKREKKALGPKEIAEAGVARGFIKVPRGRTVGYVAQLIQTKLHANASSNSDRVYRPSIGKYKARV